MVWIQWQLRVEVQDSDGGMSIGGETTKIGGTWMWKGMNEFLFEILYSRVSYKRMLKDI